MNRKLKKVTAVLLVLMLTISVSVSTSLADGPAAFNDVELFEELLSGDFEDELLAEELENGEPLDLEGEATEKEVEESELVQESALVDALGYPVTPVEELEGSGAWDDPYRLYAEADLRAVVPGKFYELMNDITLSGTENNWIPIGTYGNGYYGEFDGGGHAVYNVQINSSESYQGFFGKLGQGERMAEIRNLSIKGSNIKGSDHVGGIAGYADYSRINSCGFEGTVVGNDNVGGLIGSAVSISFQLCYNAGDITAVGNAGGIIGGGRNNSTSFCINSGNITAGINAAGIAVDADAFVVRSLNTGNVRGGSGAAGISIVTTAGKKDWVARCVAAGNVIEGSDAYRISPESTSTDNNHAYDDTLINGVSVSGIDNPVHGFDATLEQLKSQEFYESTLNWNFTSALKMSTVTGFPILQWVAEEEPEGPKVITTVEQLQAINQDLFGDYILGADIDLDGIDWDPIAGGVGESFSGTLDGAGYVIKNMSSSAPNAGLFRSLYGAEIRNLGIDGYSFAGENMQSAGGIAAGSLNSTIENCYIIDGYIQYAETAGGLLGTSYKDEATGSFAIGQLSGGIAGGFIGDAYGTVISECYAGAAVIGPLDNSCAGGLIGVARSVHIDNSYTADGVEGAPDCIMGTLIGHAFGESVIINCYTLAQLDGQEENIFIGIKGADVSINDCYMLDESGNTEPYARTMEQMKDEATYKGWDFENIWVMDWGTHLPVQQSSVIITWEEISAILQNNLNESEREMKEAAFSKFAEDETPEIALRSSGVSKVTLGSSQTFTSCDTFNSGSSKKGSTQLDHSSTRIASSSAITVIGSSTAWITMAKKVEIEANGNKTIQNANINFKGTYRGGVGYIASGKLGPISDASAAARISIQVIDLTTDEGTLDIRYVHEDDQPSIFYHEGEFNQTLSNIPLESGHTYLFMIGLSTTAHSTGLSGASANYYELSYGSKEEFGAFLESINIRFL